MNRVERKKLEQRQKKIKIKKMANIIISFIFIITLLILGLIVVDKNNMNMLLWEESKLFKYKKIDSNSYEVVFCGDKYAFDTEKIVTYILKTKEVIKEELKQVKEFIKEKR